MKPILFNTEMVRAILDGRKTTTRRVIKPQPSCELRRMNDECHCGQWHEYSEKPFCDTVYKSPWGAGYPGPLGNVGDVLYVRETFCKYDTDHVINGVKYAYKADATADSEEARKELGYKWRPSIHMPKEAARIFLRVTDVKAEKLQDIDDEGAKNEGSNVGIGVAEKMRHGAIDRFAEIWDKTVKPADRDKYGWNANPWVWVIEFERCEKPEPKDAH